MPNRSEPVPAIDYSIIIPAFNEAEFLPLTLGVLNGVMAALSYSGEVIVVDNNSNDTTAAVAREYGAEVVFERVNQISRARNLGAANSRGRYLIFLDADTLVNRALLNAALNALETGGFCGGGATLSYDREHVGAATMVKLWNFLSRQAHLAAGCFIFVRREAFEAVGGFSEQVYASEEIWLSRALHKRALAQRQRFGILDECVVTSSRKLDWLSSTAIAKQILVFLLFPWAVRSKRWCGAWYRRPSDDAKP